MVQVSERKWSRLIFTLYLALAVAGAFTLSAFETDAFYFFESKGKLTNSSGFFTSVNHNIDCLAEDTVTLSRTNRHSSITLRNLWLRTFVLSGMQNTGTYLSVSSLNIADEHYVPFPKNTILIKLRI
jgi:hypothetical protein